MAELFSVQYSCLALITFGLGIINTLKNIVKLSCVYLFIQQAGYRQVTVLRTRVINFGCTGASWDSQKTGEACLSLQVKCRVLNTVSARGGLKCGNKRFPDLGSNI